MLRSLRFLGWQGILGRPGVRLPARVGWAGGHACRLTGGVRADRPLASSFTGALMLRAVRHNLRILCHLAALFVLLGMFTVPVECAAVYGPHSIFISADEVARVRESAHHTHGTPLPASGLSSMAMPVQDAPSHEATSSAPEPSGAGVTTRLPVPAGTMIDALIAVALFETNDAPGPNDFEAIPRFISFPEVGQLPAPASPPPQPGS